MTSRQRLEAEDQAEEARYRSVDLAAASPHETARLLRRATEGTRETHPSTRAWLAAGEEDDQEDPTP